jgi:hypothetical protein
MWRTCSAPRESIQMMARMSGRPRSSTGTVPDHCELQATPTTRLGSTPEEPRTRRVPWAIARHQSSGSCSTPPPPRTCSGYRSSAEPTISPRGVVTATFNPDVPRSRATMYSSALVTEGPSPGGRAQPYWSRRSGGTGWRSASPRTGRPSTTTSSSGPSGGPTPTRRCSSRSPGRSSWRSSGPSAGRRRWSTTSTCWWPPGTRSGAAQVPPAHLRRPPGRADLALTAVEQVRT